MDRPRRQVPHRLQLRGFQRRLIRLRGTAAEPETPADQGQRSKSVTNFFVPNLEEVKNKAGNFRLVAERALKVPTGHYFPRRRIAETRNGTHDKKAEVHAAVDLVQGEQVLHEVAEYDSNVRGICRQWQLFAFAGQVAV